MAILLPIVQKLQFWAEKARKVNFCFCSTILGFLRWRAKNVATFLPRLGHIDLLIPFWVVLGLFTKGD